MQAIEVNRGFVFCLWQFCLWRIFLSVGHDHIGHMNVQFYVMRFDEASWHFLARLGLSPGFLKQQNRSLVALDQRTQYTPLPHGLIERKNVFLNPKKV